MSCRCEERKEMIKRAVNREVSVREAASYVGRTMKEDAAGKVMRKLNQRFNRRAA